jgi:hypothetical protein
MPYHVLKYINFNVTSAENGATTGGLNGFWPGQTATAGELLPGAPFTISQLNTNPATTLVGTGPWMLGSISDDPMTGPQAVLYAYSNFFMKPIPGAISFKYTWLNSSIDAQPSGGYFKVGLSDLVLLANAYGTQGAPPSSVPLNATPGAPHAWNPAADLAAPAGIIGLSDLVTLAMHYGWYYGNYSYNIPTNQIPPSEQTYAAGNGWP